VVSSATTDPGEFSTLLAALSAAGLLGTVNTAQDLTVFAPTNAAFAALEAASPGIIGVLLSDPQGGLADVLLYHVATPAQSGAELVAASPVGTLLGPTIVVTMPDSNVILNGSTTVVIPNIAASNGIVHAIDMVLIPPAP
jgi:uncharacterized surface protein with fasciclin (FAS1) repeats